MKAKTIMDRRHRFGKIASEITQNITVDYNQRLFDQKIKDVVVQISDKYQDKEKNKIVLQMIMESAKPDDEIIKLLNVNYKDMFLNYYLKSNKSTFEGEFEDESFEAHIEKMEKIYGNRYAFSYKRNAENLISFFYKVKKRIRKKKLNGLIKPVLCNSNNPINNWNYPMKIRNFNFGDFANTMVSESTQTEIYISDDDEDDLL